MHKITRGRDPGGQPERREPGQRRRHRLVAGGAVEHLSQRKHAEQDQNQELEAHQNNLDPLAEHDAAVGDRRSSPR